MLQLVEVPHVPEPVQGPATATEHPRLVLEELRVREEGVDELVEEDGGAEDEVEEGKDSDAELEVADQLLLVGG